MPTPKQLTRDQLHYAAFKLLMRRKLWLRLRAMEKTPLGKKIFDGDISELDEQYNAVMDELNKMPVEIEPDAMNNYEDELN